MNYGSNGLMLCLVGGFIMFMVIINPELILYLMPLQIFIWASVVYCALKIETKNLEEG